MHSIAHGADRRCARPVRRAGRGALACPAVPRDHFAAVDRLAAAVVTTPRLVVEQVLGEVDRSWWATSTRA